MKYVSVISCYVGSVNLHIFFPGKWEVMTLRVHEVFWIGDVDCRS